MSKLIAILFTVLLVFGCREEPSAETVIICEIGSNGKVVCYEDTKIPEGAELVPKGER